MNNEDSGNHLPDEPGGGDWWCALPDTDATAPATAALRRTGSAVLADYPSGRPWIIGSHRAGTVRITTSGAARAALLGECPATDEQFATAADQGIERLMNLPGSFHGLIAQAAGQAAAGDIAGFRRLFTARVEGLPVLSDHAYVLRLLLGAPVDRVWLACRLASPEAPSVLRDRLSPFTGVLPVPAGHRAEIVGGRCRIARWWEAPASGLSRASGASALRHALSEAVIGRIDHAVGAVSVQLSGGLDSTALAALAYPARPLLITTAGRSPVNDDLSWACRAAGQLPGCPQRIIGAAEAPLFFSGLDVPLRGVDEPVPFAAGAARQRYTAELLAAHEASLHLNGQGGDEVLLAPLAYLGTALRTVPGTGWRHLRGHAALRGIRVSTLARAALRRTSFASWLRDAAETLRTEPPAAQRLTGWEAPPVLPPWATPDAAEVVATAIGGAEPEPADRNQATHAALARIRASAYRAGMYRDMMAEAGVPTAMPFFDRAVVEACLSVAPWERTDPWQPKPLLRAALSGTLPADLLCRRTKSDYNADIHSGWTACRDHVAEYLASPRLADYGLADTCLMRRAMAAFGPGGLPPAWITDLIAIEKWLRDLDTSSTLPPAARSRPLACFPCQPVFASQPAPTDLPVAAPGPLQPKPPSAGIARTVRVTPVDDGITLLDAERGTLYHVNRPGALILATLTGSEDRDAAADAAVAALVTRYGISPEEARADVTALLGQLRDRRLLAEPGRPN